MRRWARKRVYSGPIDVIRELAYSFLSNLALTSGFNGFRVDHDSDSVICISTLFHDRFTPIYLWKSADTYFASGSDDLLPSAFADQRLHIDRTGEMMIAEQRRRVQLLADRGISLHCDRCKNDHFVVVGLGMSVDDNGTVLFTCPICRVPSITSVPVVW